MIIHIEVYNGLDHGHNQSYIRTHNIRQHSICGSSPHPRHDWVPTVANFPRRGGNLRAARREARCGLWMKNIKNSRGHQPSKPAMKLDLEEFFKNDSIWLWSLMNPEGYDGDTLPVDRHWISRNRKCFLDKLLYQVVVICHQINGYSLNMLSAAQIVKLVPVCRWTRNHQNEC